MTTEKCRPELSRLELAVMDLVSESPAGAPGRPPRRRVAYGSWIASDDDAAVERLPLAANLYRREIAVGQVHVELQIGIRILGQQRRRLIRPSGPGREIDAHGHV